MMNPRSSNMKSALCIAVICSSMSLVAVNQLMADRDGQATAAQTKVVDALRALKMIPAPKKLIGAPQKLTVTKETLEMLKKALDEEKILVVDAEGTVTIEK